MARKLAISRSRTSRSASSRRCAASTLDGRARRVHLGGRPERAAARPRSCASSRASSPRAPASVLLDGRALHGPGGDRGFVFQNDSLLPWRTVLANALIGPRGRGPGRPGRAAAHAGAAQAGRARRLRALLSAPAVRRHAPARQSRPRARDRSRNPADGRAVLVARRADPRDHADRAAAHLGGGPQDRAVRHPPDRRGGVPVRPRAGVCAPARTAAGERRDRAAAAARAGDQAHAANSCAMSITSGG